jgi:two-component system, chemotaxis family, response regulator Rcp1
LKKIKSIDVLLVKDKPDELRLIKEVFKNSVLFNKIHVANDWTQVSDFLFMRNDYNNTRMPDLIILDLNLSGKLGKQLLSETEEDNNLKKITVVVLTAAAEDISKTYTLHANCYVTKPMYF